MSYPFRYIIASTTDGEVFGTNDVEVAHNHARSEDNFVTDCKEGVWIDCDLDTAPLKEAP